ncbi:SAM-dependent methyltransferase [Paludisphaera rhizosphaerae]|uniref:SAM-dependent methyltransferase n=1 Tax=Paludisphaera rhizosphaerae TaxID=2711216 RepID=UPI0013EB5A20|nr:methyltransferase domain-containing protein [Paludisphaera rhizosphaerae]
MSLDDSLALARFPRASRYSPEWMLAGFSGAANPLWLAEWLTEALDLRPGMRVLDLSCGRALSSIFLHREFGVQVWAVDLWFSASENLRRIQAAGAEDAVFPIHADARNLPFAAEFFDAIVSIDSFFYYGTDDLYLNEIARFVKPGGPLAIAGAGLMHEFDDGTPPEHLREWWEQDKPWCLHSAAWWRRHWGRTGILDVETADELEGGWRYWRAWVEAVAPDNAVELAALGADRGRTLGYFRTVGRRRADALLTEPITSVAMPYIEKPMLRRS